MVNLIIILGISAGMFLVDLKALKKKKKELIIYLTILTFGIGLFAAEAFHLEIPNPLNVIIFLFKPMTQWINSFFK
ncbi:hypothetical protein [Rossellomorea aquimaris]|uniref:Uncharacterized protein n=1 Tax=Rossellomorea aquimaris TaxID=189382 RepID=A0A1J6WUY1_9BACI|nr:hypothetical protein [Rossellomorea aquimaris]OIU71687.1 hypothetical protein BHE18_03225 [Rossellomorea aquimaris]